MAKLTANVVVADPETGEPRVIVEGDDLPVWAKDLVGDHVLDKTVRKTADK